jgi:hypothetical protein
MFDLGIFFHFSANQINAVKITVQKTIADWSDSPTASM